MGRIVKINILMSNCIVGQMALTRDNRCAFQYDPEWLNNGFSISPFELPLKKEVLFAKRIPFDGNFGVFDDALPDGWGLLILDRFLKNRNIDTKDLSILDLLSYTGSNGRGALQFVPDLSESSDTNIQNFKNIEKNIDNILKTDSYTGQGIEELWKRGGSPGGARPKIFVTIDNEEWMVKFPAQYDSPDIGVKEYNYSLLAKKCGIEMTDTKMMENRYFATKRFDRKPGGIRIHTVSAAGLLGADYRLPSIDYLQLMQLTRILTQSDDELWKMFRLMTFNYLIGNKDDHAKNFSFLYDNNHWRLSPAYDILPSEGFNGYHTTTINNNINPIDKDLIEVAENSGLNVGKAVKVLSFQRDIIHTSGYPCI